MPKTERGPTKILKSEVNRVMQAASAIGAKAIEIDPSTGRIIVRLAGTAKGAEHNEWDRELYGKDQA